MPLIGTDFSAAQRTVLRLCADLVNPGMSDAEVLEWATSQGVDAAVAQAVELAVAKVNEDTNQARRAALDPVYEALPDPDPDPDPEG